MGFDLARAIAHGRFFRAFLFGSAAAIAAPIAPQALAQEAGPEAPAPEVEDEIVVVGSRPLAESEAAALMIQRSSDNLVSVLAADAIGRLPDQNIAFAIGRLPGVALERDQGQARYVNLRGSPRYWTTLSFDGLTVVSPEGRETRFDNIPSAIAKRVLVNKAITPDMPGTTVAGNVDVITRNAFDYDGFKLFGNTALGYVQLGGGEESDNSLVVSNQFLDGTLGVMIQGSFYKRNMVTDNWETDPYVRTTNPLTPRFAREYENKPYRLTRQNSSFSMRADYRPSDNHSLFGSVIWTQYEDEELRNNYIFRLDQGTRDPRSTPVEGIVYGARLDVNTNSLESQEDSYISTLGGESLMGGWTIDWRANYTYTKDGRDAPALPTFQSSADPALRPSVVYNFTQGDNNTVRLFRTNVAGSTRTLGAAVQNIDDFQWPFLAISKRIGSDDTQAYTLKLDLDREVEMFGRDVELGFGAMWTDRIKKSNEVSWTASAAQIAAAGLTVPTFANFRNGKPYQGDYVLGYNFTYHSKDAVDRYIAGLIQRGVATRNNTSNNFYKVGEQVLAGYGMAKVNQDWGNIVFGARVEKVENTGRAIAQTVGFTNVSSEDTLIYPSAHVNIDLNDTDKLRVGITSSASRPDFDDLRPNFTFNDTARTISGGNPEAKNEKQRGIDVYFERYGEDKGYFSAGVFYKLVEDVLFVQSDVFGLTVLNTPGIDRSGYTLTTVRNGGDGYLVGGEVFYSTTAAGLVDRLGLPAWLGGFGVRGSATWTSSEVTIPAVGLAPDRRILLPGTSDGVYNLQATYEMFDLSVRLAYQYRTAWRQSVGNYTTVSGVVVPDGNGDIFWDDDDELDLSVRYRLSDAFEVYFDGVNLLDGGGRRYADSPNHPIEYETFGRRYIAGVRFNF
jgi:TonB-dependent receptor